MTWSGVAPARTFVGIDVGGTATRFVAVDEELTVLQSAIASTPARATPAELETFFAESVAELVVGSEIAAIGVGVSGPISAEGIIQNPDTLPALTGVNVPALLRHSVGVPAYIDNDAVTAALGEATVGAGRGYDHVLMVTLGTGVGVSMLNVGEPVRGADGQHPEAGHLGVDGPPAPCYCGRRCCWEQLASRQALQRSCTVLVEDPRNSSADIDLVADRATSGDPVARAVFDDYGRRLAAGAATLLTVFRPQILILGGSGSTYFPHFERALHDALAEVTGAYPTPRIAVAEFGEYGGAIGAAVLAIARSA
ncbi:ROK family protein [Galbitalea soli]|uniref:ROK family protein n=1 Tax=Galbitalea soli TaxID=1268042 RepID=A0A7C9PML7_9MICO|nr:ROK family protein [Galbitalea soli]NEM90871.1 ROK family protein [Galbitalea soli]NYJ31591.1 glucokinase [Galbitalea soli]